MIIRLVLAVAAWLFVASAPLAAQASYDEAITAPYRLLREAYAARDPELAASAYSTDARLIYRYEGAPEETYEGTEQIAESFARFFAQVDPALPLDINFRIGRSGTRHDNGNLTQYGVYRLRYGTAETNYGRFDTVLVRTGSGFRFKSGGDASAEQFEAARGPVMFDEDAHGF